MKRLALAVALAALAAPGVARAAGPTPTAGPTVTGTAQQGKKLTALTGTWLGSGTITYAFQWYRCDANAAHCSSIHGSTKSTYTQVPKDVGHSLGLTVHATDSSGTADAYAAVTGLVAPATATLVANAQPVLAGDPIVGTAVTVQNATWSVTPTATTYTWLRCNANGRACAAIAGQTASTYTLATADIGDTLVAAATGASGAAKTTVLTVRSAVVRTAPGPVLSVAPAITGTVQQGKKLSATPGTWSSGGSIAYAYQWYRCDPNGAHCSSIHGSTKGTYTVVAKDVGQTLALTVHATDSTGTTAAYSPLAGLVAPATAPLVPTAQPKLDGTTSVGSTLKVEAVTWNATPTATTYAWLRCNANERICTKIAGQTTDSYVVTAADAGATLVAEVIGTSGQVQQTELALGALVPAA